MNLRPFAAAGLALCSGLAVATSAEAAPAPTCVSATMTPAAAAFPANLPAFGYTATTATAKDVHSTPSDPTQTELPLTVGPEVVDGYAEGRCRRHRSSRARRTSSSSAVLQLLRIPDEAALVHADRRGAAADEARRAHVGTDRRAHRLRTTQVAIKATYSVAAEMKPWAAVYQLGMVFDGQVVETHPTFSGDAAQIDASAWCDDAASKTNKHTLQLRARLPFAPSVETTFGTIEFVCPAPRITTAPDNGAVKPVGTSGSSGASAGSPSTTGGCSTSPAAPLPLLRSDFSSRWLRSCVARGASAPERLLRPVRERAPEPLHGPEAKPP